MDSEWEARGDISVVCCWTVEPFARALQRETGRRQDGGQPAAVSISDARETILTIYYAVILPAWQAQDCS